MAARAFVEDLLESLASAPTLSPETPSSSKTVSPKLYKLLGSDGFGQLERTKQSLFVQACLTDRQVGIALCKWLLARGHGNHDDPVCIWLKDLYRAQSTKDSSTGDARDSYAVFVLQFVPAVIWSYLLRDSRSVQDRTIQTSPGLLDLLLAIGQVDRQRMQMSASHLEVAIPDLHKPSSYHEGYTSQTAKKKSELTANALRQHEQETAGGDWHKQRSSLATRQAPQKRGLKRWEEIELADEAVLISLTSFVDTMHLQPISALHQFCLLTGRIIDCGLSEDVLGDAKNGVDGKDVDWPTASPEELARVSLRSSWVVCMVRGLMFCASQPGVQQLAAEALYHIHYYAVAELQPDLLLATTCLIEQWESSRLLENITFAGMRPRHSSSLLSPATKDVKSTRRTETLTKNLSGVIEEGEDDESSNTISDSKIESEKAAKASVLEGQELSASIVAPHSPKSTYASRTTGIATHDVTEALTIPLKSSTNFSLYLAESLDKLPEASAGTLTKARTNKSGLQVKTNGGEVEELTERRRSSRKDRWTTNDLVSPEPIPKSPECYDLSSAVVARIGSDSTIADNPPPPESLLCPEPPQKQTLPKKNMNESIDVAPGPLTPEHTRLHRPSSRGSMRSSSGNDQNTARHNSKDFAEKPNLASSDFETAINSWAGSASQASVITVNNNAISVAGSTASATRKP